jgi:hypothetical protein
MSEQPPDSRTTVVPASQREPKSPAVYRRAEKQVVLDRDGREHTLVVTSLDATLAGELDGNTFAMIEAVESAVKGMPNLDKLTFGGVIKSIPALKVHAAKVLVAGMGAKQV